MKQFWPVAPASAAPKLSCKTLQTFLAKNEKPQLRDILFKGPEYKTRMHDILVFMACAMRQGNHWL